MVKITLEGVKTDGTSFENTVDLGIDSIDLSAKQLASVDLGPLAKCKNVQWLKLESNQLEEIDLSPLKDCNKLRFLDLHGNRLVSIDLSPLAACNKLRFLDLRDNQLASIDLSPLATCNKLRKLFVDTSTGLVGENNLQRPVIKTALSRKEKEWRDSNVKRDSKTFGFTFEGNKESFLNKMETWLTTTQEGKRYKRKRRRSGGILKLRRGIGSPIIMEFYVKQNNGNSLEMEIVGYVLNNLSITFPHGKLSLSEKAILVAFPRRNGWKDVLSILDYLNVEKCKLDRGQITTCRKEG